jgi:uncharacterized protein (TIRG00374 family)
MQKYQRLVWIGILIGLLPFIVVTLVSDINKVAAQALLFPWLFMIPVLFLRALNWMIRGGKWYFLLKLVGVQGFSLRDNTSVFLTGLAFAASPGKLAELLKCFMLRQLTGAPVLNTMPTIMAERVTDGTAVVLLLVAAVFATAQTAYLPVVAAALVFNLMIVIVLAIRPLCLGMLNLMERFPIIGKWAHGFRQLYESAYILFRVHNWSAAVGTGLVSSTLDGLGVWFILIGLGYPATITTFWYGLLAISLSVIIGSVSGMPSGAGASDATILAVLSLGLGMSPAEAGFATLLARFVQAWWGVLVGMVVGFVDRDRLFSPGLEAQIADDEQRRRGTPPQATLTIP